MLLFLIVIAFAAFFYQLCLKPLDYWKQKGVQQNNRWVTMREILLSLIPYRSLSDAIQRIYNEFPDVRYFGGYQFLMPNLFIKDSELIKQLTVKDFDYFIDHNQMVSEENEPILGKNLFSLRGDRWKTMRATLSPSFTSSKMKLMFGLIGDYAKAFVQNFEGQTGIIALDFQDTFTRFTNDVIATSAFGINCDSIKNPNNGFYLMGKELTNFRGFTNNLRFLFVFMFPQLTKLLGVKFFNKKSNTYFCNLVKKNLKSRQESGFVRPDMIHLLMEARKGKLKPEQEPETDEIKLNKPPLTDTDIVAQALIFFIAGYVSVSTTMCFTAHELAINTDVQERLQKEIDKTLVECGGSLTYETLSEMKYMNMVVSESLRKWPPALILDRVCVKPYVIEPVNEGEKPLYIKKGELLMIPTFALQRDPNYFPDPDRFDPERFSDENKNRINPYVYIPFGVGPRSCIGNRFALMEVKMLFFYLLSKFDLVVVNKTTVPLKVGRSSFQLTADGGFWLGLKPRILR